MRVLKYIFTLFILAYAISADAQPKSRCRAVQIKFHPFQFGGVLDQGIGGGDGDGNRDPSMAFHIRYTIVKNDGLPGSIDTVLFISDEECYKKRDIANGPLKYGLNLMDGLKVPYYATLCFEGDIDLSDYYILTEAVAHGWDERRYARRTRYRNTPNCTGDGRERTVDFVLNRQSLNELNTTISVTHPLAQDRFSFSTKIEKIDIPYPQLSMPEVINVCANEFPYILNIDSSAYTYNLKMKYFDQRKTTISKYNSSTSSWGPVSGMVASPATSFEFDDPGTAGRYAVYTELNGDCWMTDTFDLNVLPIPTIYNNNGNIADTTNYTATICPNGITTLSIIADTNHTAFVWKDQYNACISRYPNLTVEDTGSYTIQVKAVNGCYHTETYEVTYKPTEVVKFADEEILSCFTPDLPSPQINLTTNVSGIGGYHFKWSTKQTSADITVTQPGAYRVEATDGFGCISYATVHVIDTCKYPVHSDVVANSAITYLDKSLFNDPGMNTIVLEDPRSASGGIPYSTGDIADRKYLVRLQYHRSLQSDLKADIWAVFVPYQITVDSRPAEYRTLHLKKTNAEEDIYTSIFEHEGGDKATVQVLYDNIAAYDKDGNIISFEADIPLDINLELELKTVHVPAFTSALTVDESKLEHHYDIGNQKIEIVWQPIRSAIEYELQVAFIDALDKNQTINDRLFKEKGWSIVTPANSYTIDATYPKGTFVYRIRPVGRRTKLVNHNYNHIINGTWTSAQSIDLKNSAFEQDRNWSKIVTFAEEGKKKEVVTYMDGTFRTRQVLTNLNTEGITLAAETYYDHEGRGTLSVLPVPLTVNNLKYQTSLNLDISGQLIDTSFVDNPVQQPLSNTTGAAQYYSVNNPFTTNPVFTDRMNINALPDAGGYVTTKVEYSRDNTGRVIRQSGVGEEFIIDGVSDDKHFTQYFYNTPAQTELHRLFGSNVGEAVFYTKQMVVDPNGQVSISYLNNSEKVIATALSGNAPDNLDSLDRPVPVSMAVDMSGNNIRDSLSRTSTSVNIIGNDVVGKDYTFFYQVGAGKNEGTFNEQAYCKNCKYKLELSISNPKGLPVVLQPQSLPAYATTITNGNNDIIKIQAILDADLCNNPSYTYPDIEFSSSFEKLGNYIYTKKLTLLEEDELDIQDFLEQIEFPSLEEFITEHSKENIDSLLCRSDCASRTAVYIRDMRYQDSLRGSIRTETEYGNITDSLVNRGFCDPFLTAQFEAPEYARKYCDDMLMNMVRQTSPGEKYFDLSDPSSRVYTVLTNSVAPGRDSLIALNILRSSSAGGANSADSIAYRWNDDAARKILEWFGSTIHPEYCHYENCQADTARNTFDIKMGLIDSYLEAVEMGYIINHPTDFYRYGPALDAEINQVGGLREKLEEYIRIPFSYEGKLTYLLTASPNTFANRIRKINIINAVRPHNVYYNPEYLTIPDSGYSTSLIYYGDSCQLEYEGACVQLSPEYDKDGNGTISKTEWDDQFWLRFKTAFLATKKQQLAANKTNCAYLNDGSAIVKNPNISVTTGYAQATTYHTPQAYLSNCTANVNGIMEKLTRECKAVREKIETDTAYRSVLRDSLIAYCVRNTDPYNPYGFITQNAIDSGKLDNIIASIHLNATGSDSCDLGMILNSGIDYFYGRDSSGNVVVYELCVDTGNCSVASIIDIANEQNFQYPKVGTEVFREGFDNTDPDHYFATNNYKNTNRYNGLILNNYTASDWVASIENDFVNIASFMCLNWDPIFRDGIRNSTRYVNDFNDATGSVFGNYLLNYTNGSFDHSGIFWRNLDPIPVEEHQNYLLSYHLANHIYGNTNIVPIIRTRNNSYVDTLFVQMDTISCVSAWNKYQIRWKAPAGVDSIFIEMVNRRSDDWGNDFSFDELKLETLIDTSEILLPCAGNKPRKFSVTPSEITASYAACANATGGGGGLYTIFFIDSTGNRVENIASMDIDPIPVLSEPVFTAPVVYPNRSVKFLKMQGVATLTDDQERLVYLYEASCATRDIGYWSGNSACTDLQGITSVRNNDLAGGSNYACERRFDTCVVRYIPKLDSLVVSWEDSLKKWVPDTSFQSCIDRQVRSQQGWLTQIYQDSLAKVLTAYRTTHIANCFKDLTEDLYYSTTFDEYHYTLYYYDQQGNLVQTIPPAGVHPVPPSGFTDEGKWKGGSVNEPKHVLSTSYQYNTRQQPIAQHSPDGGLSTFWYNKKGQLILSQNEKQKPAALMATAETTSSSVHQSRFSFTNYDPLGRIVLVGEIITPDNFTYHPSPGDASDVMKQRRRDTLNILANTFGFPLNYLEVPGYQLVNLVQTEYDYSTSLPGLNQKNLHNRVSATYAYDDYGKLLAGEGIATIYSYDEIGNVETMVQDMSKYEALANLPQISDAEQLRKQVDYDYDLVSGKVNAVVYNHGKDDQFKHRYEYDADNRITDVYTSDANDIEHHDAKYFYYPHGPLARIELGNNKVQSLDYVYTLQGWLKGINFLENNNAYDIHFAKNQFLYLLGYYSKDYQALSASNYQNEGAFMMFAPHYHSLSNRYQGLYNGNIAFTTNILSGLSQNQVHFDNHLPITSMEYRYDQLNRIKSAYGQSDEINGIDRNPNGRSILYQSQSYDLYDAYRTNYQYDANGNITSLKRTAPHFASREFKTMDSLRYVYACNNFSGTNKLLNNRLYQVFDDQADDSWFDTDIDNQIAAVSTTPTAYAHPNTNLLKLGESNYEYDKIGNLTRDQKEGIEHIYWTPYGKIDSIAMTAPKSDLKFKYDATGNRVAKIEYPKPVNGQPQEAKVTYYFRDAQGNPIDIVQPQYDNSVYSELHEYNVYGSSRLGTWTKIIELVNMGIQPDEQVFGNKQYELNNHLGNVMTTITDQKYMTASDGYVPVATTVTDYYPFGMPMPGRTYQKGDCVEEYVRTERMGNGRLVEEGDFNGGGNITVDDWFSSVKFMSVNGYQIGTIEWVPEELKFNLREGFNPEDSMTIGILVHEFAVPSAGVYKISFDLDKSDTLDGGCGIVRKDTLDYDFFYAFEHGGVEDVALSLQHPLTPYNEMTIQVSEGDTLAIFFLLNSPDTILRSVKIDNFLVEKIAENVLVDINDAENNRISEWFVPDIRLPDTTWNDYIRPLSRNVIDTVSGYLSSYYHPNAHEYYGYASRDYIVNPEKTYRLSYNLVNRHYQANRIAVKVSDEYRTELYRYSGNLFNMPVNPSIGNNEIYFTPNDTVVTVAWWAESYGAGDTLQPYFTITNVILEECIGNDPVVEDLVFQDSFNSGNQSSFLDHYITNPSNITAHIELDSATGTLEFKTIGENQLGSCSMNLFHTLPSAGYYRITFDFSTEDTTGLNLQAGGNLTDSAYNYLSPLFWSNIISDTSFNYIFYANDRYLRLNFYMYNRDTSLSHTIRNFKIHQLYYTDTCTGIATYDDFSGNTDVWRNSVHTQEYLLENVKNFNPVTVDFGSISWDSLNHSLNIHKNSFPNIAGVRVAKQAGMTDMWFALAAKDLTVETGKQYRVDFSVSNLQNASQGMLGNMFGIWNSQLMTYDPFEGNSNIGMTSVEENGRHSFVLDAPADSLILGLLNISHSGMIAEIALQLDSIEIYEIERLSSYDSTLVLDHHFQNNDTTYVSYLENLGERNYIGEVEYDSIHHRLKVKMIDDEEGGYSGGVLRKMNVSSGKDVRIQVGVSEDSVAFEGFLVVVDNLLFSEPQMYPVSGAGLHEIVLPSQSGSFQLGVLAFGSTLGSFYLDSVKVYELDNIVTTALIESQSFDMGTDGWRSSFKASDRIPFSTLEWIEDSTVLKINMSDYLSALNIAGYLDSVNGIDLHNIFKLGVTAIPLEVSANDEHLIQYKQEIQNNYLDSFYYSSLLIYDRQAFEQAGQNVFGLAPIYIHVDSNRSNVNPEMIRWTPTVDEVVFVFLTVRVDTSSESVVLLRDFRVSTIDSSVMAIDTIFYQPFADSSSIAGWRNSFLEPEDAMQELELSVLTHDTATGRMRVGMLQNPMDDSPYPSVQGITGRRLSGLKTGKEYVVQFRLETDSINDLYDVDLALFRTITFDQDVSVPDTVVYLPYPSDTLEVRFEALDSNMVMVIVVNRPGADPYHYYIDDYSLTEGWIEHIGIEEISGEGNMVFCSSFDTLGTCTPDTSGWINEVQLISGFSSIRMGELSWQHVPAQDSSGVLVVQSQTVFGEDEGWNGLAAKDLGLIDTGQYELKIDIGVTNHDVNSYLILAYTDSLSTFGEVDGEDMFARARIPLSGYTVNGSTHKLSFTLNTPAELTLIATAGDSLYHRIYLDNILLGKKTYLPDTIPPPATPTYGHLETDTVNGQLKLYYDGSFNTSMPKRACVARDFRVTPGKIYKIGYNLAELSSNVWSLRFELKNKKDIYIPYSSPISYNNIHSTDYFEHEFIATDTLVTAYWNQYDYNEVPSFDTTLPVFVIDGIQLIECESLAIPYTVEIFRDSFATGSRSGFNIEGAYSYRTDSVLRVNAPEEKLDIYPISYISQVNDTITEIACQYYAGRSFHHMETGKYRIRYHMDAPDVSGGVNYYYGSLYIYSMDSLGNSYYSVSQSSDTTGDYEFTVYMSSPGFRVEFQYYINGDTSQIMSVSNITIDRIIDTDTCTEIIRDEFLSDVGSTWRTYLVEELPAPPPVVYSPVWSEDFDHSSSLTGWRSSVEPFSLTATRLGNFEWDAVNERGILTLDQDRLGDPGEYTGQIVRHLTGMRAGATYQMKYRLTGETSESFDQGVVSIVTEERLANGLPIPYFKGASVPDTAGWIVVSFEAPAESFWIAIGAEKLGGTEPTTAYIDDISLREGWIQDRKCPLPGSIYAKKGKYRFGFNGKENDSEVRGQGNQQDYGMRIYDPRIGKFLSVDPLTKEYPWNSTYAFAENDVIRCIDLDGLEKVALSGASLPNQYYLPIPGSNPPRNTPGHTAYTRTHVKFFKAQAMRLQNQYGYHASQVFTGADIVDKLVAETKNHGNITSLTFFGHGGTSGFYLNNNQGFYSTAANSTGVAGSASIADIQAKMKTGDIKFSKDAVCFMDACNGAGSGQLYSQTPGYEFAMATGVTTIAATGSVSMVDETKADGRFKTKGEFLKLTRVEYTKTVQIANPNKKWWQIWKSDTVDKQEKDYYIKSESLGNEINMDDYIEK